MLFFFRNSNIFFCFHKRKHDLTLKIRRKIKKIFQRQWISTKGKRISNFIEKLDEFFFRKFLEMNVLISPTLTWHDPKISLDYADIRSFPLKKRAFFFFWGGEKGVGVWSDLKILCRIGRVTVGRKNSKVGWAQVLIIFGVKVWSLQITTLLSSVALKFCNYWLNQLSVHSFQFWKTISDFQFQRWLSINALHPF